MSIRLRMITALAAVAAAAPLTALAADIFTDSQPGCTTTVQGSGNVRSKLCLSQDLSVLYLSAPLSLTAMCLARLSADALRSRPALRPNAQRG